MTLDDDFLIHIPGGLPRDPELQAMENSELKALLESKPPYSVNPDWARVAKEIRHRKRFNRWSDQ